MLFGWWNSCAGMKTLPASCLQACLNASSESASICSVQLLHSLSLRTRSFICASFFVHTWSNYRTVWRKAETACPCVSCQTSMPVSFLLVIVGHCVDILGDFAFSPGRIHPLSHFSLAFFPLCVTLSVRRLPASLCLRHLPSGRLPPLQRRALTRRRSRRG